MTNSDRNTVSDTALLPAEKTNRLSGHSIEASRGNRPSIAYPHYRVTWLEAKTQAVQPAHASAAAAAIYADLHSCWNKSEVEQYCNVCRLR